ncbi:hypothetical protein DHEL01_v207815 [Diaporthe helianthi]|uniref:Uncharacterized protein n=1 Tax=Diaporthe helianthi TaxID=158607 RepID=A0A2P5HU62_DIAHE|nr:hypothetical protein DHEL01_v207815 [Diaporthe helianthi]
MHGVPSCRSGPRAMAADVGQLSTRFIGCSRTASALGGLWGLLISASMFQKRCPAPAEMPFRQRSEKVVLADGPAAGGLRCTTPTAIHTARDLGMPPR